MHLQAGIEDPTSGSPLGSGEAVQLSPTIAADRQGGQLVFYNASGILYTCPEQDQERVRLGAALLLGPEFEVEVQRLADFLGKSRGTLWRWRRRYEEAGAGGISYKYHGRPAHKLTGERLERAQALLDEGHDNRAVARAVEVSEGAVRYALRAGRLRRPSKGEGETAAWGSTPRERSEADQASEGGIAVLRTKERALAAQGKLEKAEPRYEHAESVARAGVLVALPVLVAQGVFEVFGQIYGKLKNGFYGLDAVVATFLLMTLLRIKTPEQISSYSPGEFGRLLGLDRAPEVKTLRRKLAELGARGEGLHLVEVFSRRWLEDQGEEVAGFLYVDGHVRPYHGRKHRLPKTWVSRRRLAMPATTDFWVNDGFSDPLFFVNAPANDGLLAMVEGAILPEVRELVGPDRRLTVVMDRESWSPERFQRWHDRGFDILTYRKKPYEDWPTERFTREEELDRTGRTRRLGLAEATYESTGGAKLREVRRLDEQGKQVSIITTRWDLSMREVATRMRARWAQENFLKYMREEFALDRLVTYAVEPADPDREVTNPAWKSKGEELSKLRAGLARAKQELGEAANSEDEKGPRATAEVRERIADLEARIEACQNERAALSKKVPLRELMDPEQIVQLEPERKRIADVIKMAAYRAESELAALVGPALGLHHEDQARNFLREVFNLNADLVPDDKARTLRVRLHSMAKPRMNRALAELCRLLNGYKATAPGAQLRVVLEPPMSQS